MTSADFRSQIVAYNPLPPQTSALRFAIGHGKQTLIAFLANCNVPLGLDHLSVSTASVFHGVCQGTFFLSILHTKVNLLMTEQEFKNI
jgi:hypothetical protein